MLDFRLGTFLILCKVGNYTKTAQLLHITQPAVTQHIKFLEEYYHSKLFVYQGRKLCLTQQGKLLQKYMIPLMVTSQTIRDILQGTNDYARSLNFGTTSVISEYYMPYILSNFSKEFSSIPISMQVENTQVLLSQLIDEKIDFAILEEDEKSEKYFTCPFLTENIFAVASKKSKLGNHSITIQDLTQERLLLSESGSSIRVFCEKLFYDNNMTLYSFTNTMQLGSFNTIIHLVKENQGIAFLYGASIQEYLKDGSLVPLQIPGFPLQKDFYFVCLKELVQEHLHWFEKLKPMIEE